MCLPGLGACLRHNFQEIEDWPPLTCHHTHHPQEWEPQEGSGGRQGGAHSCPGVWHCGGGLLVGSSGRKRAPRGPTDASYQDGGSPGALAGVRWTGPSRVGDGTYGSKPRADAPSTATVPQRAVIYKDGTLSRDVVYVGRGHHSHRIAASDWTGDACGCRGAARGTPLPHDRGPHQPIPVYRLCGAAA